MREAEGTAALVLFAVLSFIYSHWLGCWQSLVAGAVTTAACEAAQHLSPPENKR